MPIPSRLYHVIQDGHFRDKRKLTAREIGIGDQFRHITRTAGRQLHRPRAPRHPLDSINDFPDGSPRAGTEIKCARRTAV
ncbi:MAG: hypothetical protein H8D70_02785, partial [Rhodospirillaceae bacterium]|nr:hypothetical protein [Rhodospirillaceae bacterium]